MDVTALKIRTITQLGNSLRLILWLVFLMFVMCNGEWPPLDCDVMPDKQYRGISIDCSRGRFALKDLSFFEFCNVTTLVLSYNNIGILPNNTFIKFSDLKRLECTRCSIHKLNIDALKGLGNLEVLILNRNFLVYKDHSLQKGCFRHVPNIKTLNIMKNENSDYEAHNYSEYLDIFDTLPNLEDLSIDAFKNLRIGVEFTKFKALQSLQINCDSILSIADDSLEGFQNSSLTRFGMFCGWQQIPRYLIGFDVFQFLPPGVIHLSIFYLRIGNRMVLNLFKTLTGRTIDTIRLNTTYSPPYAPFSQKRHDGYLTRKAFKYVSAICVKNFHWYNSRISAIESTVVTSKTWRNCLVEGYLETDNVILNVDYIIFFKLIHMKKLRRAIHRIRGIELINEFWSDSGAASSSTLYYPTVYHQDFDASRFLRAFLKMHNMFDSIASLEESSLGVRNSDNVSEDTSCENTGQDVTNRLAVSHRKANKRILTNQEALNVKKACKKSTLTESPFALKGLNITLTLPPEIRQIVADGNEFINFVANFIFRTNKLTSISITNCIGWLRFDGTMTGLNRLESIDFQGSSLSVYPEFFQQFPSLKKLILRRINLRSDASKKNVFDSFQNIPLLEYLDIAENGLDHLPWDIFNSNSNLKYLCLASNKINKIHNLDSTPKLEILDLRGNLFSGLLGWERDMIDRHIFRVDNFTVLFDFNKLSCSCQSRDFMAWLHKKARHFDNFANYSCSSENGSLSWTGTYPYRHKGIFFRLCEGPKVFLGSLIMACAFMALYLAIFLGMKHQIQIISSIMQILTPGFRLKTRQDFPYHVFIGYAHQEGDYVRHLLLRYLEDCWRLKTFVHQRDLMQDPVLLSTALRDSWRTLLLITENFLDHYDMAHNVMKVACFFVSPSNPRSVVVMVEEDVLHRIPDYVLQVVDDDNIIVVPRLQGYLDYRDKETLKTRLL